MGQLPQESRSTAIQKSRANRFQGKLPPNPPYEDEQSPARLVQSP